jgi:hypothetical protein
MSPLDTDDWKLSAHIMWKPKRTPNRAPCAYCSGNGQIGGGFKSIDGPEDCPQCFGTGKGEETNPLAPMPPLPPGLVEHMRQAWQEFFAPASASISETGQQENGNG